MMQNQLYLKALIVGGKPSTYINYTVYKSKSHSWHKSTDIYAVPMFLYNLHPRHIYTGFNAL